MVEAYTVVLFAVILVAVPIQFFLSPASSSDTRYHIHKLTNSISDFVKSIRKSSIQSVADEVVEISDADKNENHFASSSEPRDPRSPLVKFRVGDVVKHTVHGFRGVIVGWDEKAKAPDSWLESLRKEKKEWIDLPNYAIIVDTRDRLNPQLAYVVQENLELSPGRVFHPLVRNYFESFDGKHYRPRPWHHKVYPND